VNGEESERALLHWIQRVVCGGGSVLKSEAERVGERMSDWRLAQRRVAKSAISAVKEQLAWRVTAKSGLIQSN
jgi:hypothetical protein